MTLRGWEDAQGQTTLECDDVIVGSGPGGAATARVLAEAGRRVIVIEEGPKTSRFKPNMPHTMRYHMQEGGTMIALGSAAVAVAAGRGVGGGSLINSAICWRAPDDVLTGWTSVLQDDRFRPEVMGPIYHEVEGIIGAGPTRDEIAGENNRIVVRGAEALGLPGGLLNRNTPGCVGCGICNYGCPSGGKGSVDRNLLVLARSAGATVQADVFVNEILIDGDRARGIRGVVRHPDSREPQGQLTVRASRVILAAGAVGTPRLIHTAGLAPRLGPAVGKGLHLHPGNGILGLCDHEVRMWSGATQGAYYEDPALPGVLPHTMTLPPGALLLALGGVGLSAKDNLKLVNRICGCLVMVSDKGEGSVGVKSDGTADLRYWFAPQDLELLRLGMRRTVDVLLAGGAKQVLVPAAGARWTSNREEAYATIDAASVTDYQLMYAAHPMATCRMGADPSTSVINATGEAHKLAGLYITDSSIFPTSLGVNPQLTTMALATRIAQGLVA